jgi:hypothetical protein
MTRCWAEINTGNGEFIKLFDFGQVSGQGLEILNLINNPQLLLDANTKQLDQAGSDMQQAIDTIRQSINGSATPTQTNGYDQLITTLTKIREHGILHPACIFRCLQGTK